MCVWLSVCDQFVFSEDVCLVHSVGRRGVCWTAWHHVCFLSTLPQLGMFIWHTVLEDKAYVGQPGIMYVFCPQLGMFVLYTVSQMATDQLKPHLVSMLQLLNEKLNDTQNYMVPYYAIRSVIAGASQCPGLSP